MNIEMLKLSSDEELFASKIEDMFNLVENKNISKFSHFLDERQQEICKAVAADFVGSHEYYFDGGYNEAGRKMLCILADYDSREYVNTPIESVTFAFRKQDKLTHRDFLGSLMALRIKREFIGDILVSEGMAVVFTTETMLEVILSEITKIGKIGVALSRGHGDLSEFKQKFQTISGTVSSMRLDCVLSMVMNIGRDKASQIIRSGSVSVNHVPCGDRSSCVNQGDIISVRGFGRVKISEIGSRTKKDRIHLECSKYL